MVMSAMAKNKSGEGAGNGSLGLGPVPGVCLRCVRTAVWDVRSGLGSQAAGGDWRSLR